VRRFVLHTKGLVMMMMMMMGTRWCNRSIMVLSPFLVPYLPKVSPYLTDILYYYAVVLYVCPAIALLAAVAVVGGGAVFNIFTVPDADETRRQSAVVLSHVSCHHVASEFASGFKLMRLYGCGMIDAINRKTRRAEG
jgi:hypothetical protein